MLNDDSFLIGDWIRIYEMLNDEGHLNEDGLLELKRLRVGK
jgi:hypothetical protein